MAGVEADTLGKLKLICLKELQGFFLSICWEPLLFLCSCGAPSFLLPPSVQSAVASGTPSPSTPAIPALGCLGICSLFLHPNAFSRLDVSRTLSCTGSQMEQNCLHTRLHSGLGLPAGRQETGGRKACGASRERRECHTVVERKGSVKGSVCHSNLSLS